MFKVRVFPSVADLGSASVAELESDGIDESSTTTVAVVVAKLPELSVTVRFT